MYYLQSLYCEIWRHKSVDVFKFKVIINSPSFVSNVKEGKQIPKILHQLSGDNITNYLYRYALIILDKNFYIYQ